MPLGVSAYVPLANITLGSTAASVTFSSISQSYRDLVLICNGTNTSQTTWLIRLNGSTSANYCRQSFSASSGTADGTRSETETSFIANSLDGSGVSSVQFSLLDYSATDKTKCVLWRESNVGYQVRMSAGRFPSTSAITSLSITSSASTIVAGSTFALYGIAA